MTNSLKDILLKRDYEEPAESQKIKQYVERHFQTTPTVHIQPSQIIIGVPSSALAGALRMHLRAIAEECLTTKRLVIRIGR